MKADSIALLAVGVVEEHSERQVRHLEQVIADQGFTVVPHSSQDWETVLLTVADQIAQAHIVNALEVPDIPAFEYAEPEPGPEPVKDTYTSDEVARIYDAGGEVEVTPDVPQIPDPEGDQHE